MKKFISEEAIRKAATKSIRKIRRKEISLLQVEDQLEIPYIVPDNKPLYKRCRFVMDKKARNFIHIFYMNFLLSTFEIIWEVFLMLEL